MECVVLQGLSLWMRVAVVGPLACMDLAAEVDGAQQVINAASAVQVLRVAQYAAREEEQDPSGRWVEVEHGLGHVSEFAADAFGPRTR